MIAMITKATTDIRRIARSLGADSRTFHTHSACFWGDTMLSCFGQTRNRDFGFRITKKSTDNVLLEMKNENKTVEGFETTKAAYEISQSLGLDTPVIDMIYKILYNDHEPKKLLEVI